nr:uncharacterized protein LOC131277624 [Dasypus novemcinctus]
MQQSLVLAIGPSSQTGSPGRASRPGGAPGALDESRGSPPPRADLLGAASRARGWGDPAVPSRARAGSWDPGQGASGVALRFGGLLLSKTNLLFGGCVRAACRHLGTARVCVALADDAGGPAPSLNLTAACPGAGRGRRALPASPARQRPPPNAGVCAHEQRLRVCNTEQEPLLTVTEPPAPASPARQGAREDCCLEPISSAVSSSRYWGTVVTDVFSLQLALERRGSRAPGSPRGAVLSWPFL